jgi:hypothetical protein
MAAAPSPAGDGAAVLVTTAISTDAAVVVTALAMPLIHPVSTA